MSHNNQPDPLDRILLTEEALLPSSGFAAVVMERIEALATAPEPIPFPWKRALPGLIALIASLYFLYRLASVTFAEMSRNPVNPAGWVHWMQSSAQVAVVLRTQAAPALLAVGGAWLCVALCSRLSGGWSTR